MHEVMHVLETKQPNGGFWRSGRAKRVDREIRSTPEWTALRHVVAANLQREREARNISVDELAASIGGCREKIFSWERGECLPSLPTLLAVSLALGCSLGSLVPSEIRGVHVMVRSGVERRRSEMRASVAAALAQTGWNVTAAAKLMGVQRSTLSHRIGRLGLRRKRSS